MEYTYPDYFYDFQCEASGCSDTCCAGWGIAIDQVSLEKYAKYPGFFGNRLRNSIDWETGTFEQYDRRCAFLNEEGLCDIYAEAGPKMLCKTCTRYPRHYEEYENLREISLSLSCPAAAKLILGSDKPMTFESSCRETPEEEYEEFDFFLFTKLQEIRDYLYEVIKNRELPIEERMGIILAVAHDMQTRIDRERLYEVDELLEKYRKSGFLKKAKRKLEAYRDQKVERRVELRKMWRRLYRLEVLRPDWTRFLKKHEKLLYEELCQEEYEKACLEFSLYYREREYEYEQLLMYFIFTYLCGAVYDNEVYSKVKFAVTSVMLIREMDLAVWLEKKKTLTFEDQVEIAHRFSREVEHSDANMSAVESMLLVEDVYELDRLLYGILG